jgi:hypothetical protein
LQLEGWRVETYPEDRDFLTVVGGADDAEEIHFYYGGFIGRD